MSSYCVLVEIMFLIVAQVSFLSFAPHVQVICSKSQPFILKQETQTSETFISRQAAPKLLNVDV